MQTILAALQGLRIFFCTPSRQMERQLHQSLQAVLRYSGSDQYTGHHLESLDQASPLGN